MNKFKEILLSEYNRKYWKPISFVSDSLGEILCSCSRKVFHFESFCNDNRELINIYRVDAIALKNCQTRTEVNLIEFKGGVTCQNWDKNCFALKTFDTLHCGFSKLVDNDRQKWIGLFADDTLNFNLHIVISDKHIMASLDMPDIELIKNRESIQRAQQELDKLQGKLHRYENRHPFDVIKVTSCSKFLDRINSIVDDIEV